MGYAGSIDHLLAELERIHLLVRLHYQKALGLHGRDGEWRGLCIEEKEVNSLLERPWGLPDWAGSDAGLAEEVRERAAHYRRIIDGGKEASLALGRRLRLAEVARLFQLDDLDVDILLVCLASELDLRYEKIFAYLQDDVTKKRPSVDLVLNLLCPDFRQKLECRQRLAPAAPLRRHEILHLFVDPSQPEPPLLRKYCKLDPRIVDFLLELDSIDEELAHCATVEDPSAGLESVPLPAGTAKRLLALAGRAVRGTEAATFFLRGADAAWSKATALAICGEMKLRLLVVELRPLLERSKNRFDDGIRRAVRESRLQNAAVYLNEFDLLLKEDAAPLLGGLLGSLQEGAKLSYLAGLDAWEPSQVEFGRGAFYRVEFPGPGQVERAAIWDRLLPGARAGGVDLDFISNQFRFGPGTIEAAVVTARNLARWRDPDEGAATDGELHAACRLQSNRKLGLLARKVEARGSWSDLDTRPMPSNNFAKSAPGRGIGMWSSRSGGLMRRLVWAKGSTFCSPVRPARGKPWLPR